MRVSVLHYSNSIIDLNKIFGMQRMELNEIRELKKEEIEVVLYAKDVIGEHPNIKKLVYEEYEKDLFDLPYYTRFVDINRDTDVLQGNATPLLAVFRPETTLLRFDGPIDFPMVENPTVLEAYKKTNFIFVSRYLKNYFLSRYPFIPENNCHILYNAVDYTEYIPKKPGNTTKLLFCSRWVGYKGIFILLDALKILEKKRDDYEIIIAGGIHSTKKTIDSALYEENIRNKIAQRKNVKNIGYIPHHELLTLLNEIQLLLFPSLWDEPFGLVPAEAAMASVPTIAFDTGALPEVVANGKTGLLIKKNKFDYINARRLASAIEKCLDNPTMVMSMGENARKRCMEKFNWSIYIKKLLSIYQSIINRK